jgi:WD40 repeat protein
MGGKIKRVSAGVIWNAHNLVITSMDAYKGVIASCALDGFLKLWKSSTMEMIDSLCSNKRWNYNIAWHPQGEFLFYDTDGVVTAHKIVKVTKNFKFSYKKLVQVSKEASLSTCYSPYSG